MLAGKGSLTSRSTPSKAPRACPYRLPSKALYLSYLFGILIGLVQRALEGLFMNLPTFENAMIKDFEEIGHSGGKITFCIETDGDGRRAFRVGFSSSRSVLASLFAVYALPQGVPVETVPILGIGMPFNPPPLPGCIPVFISSDSQGKFGHNCPNCDGYWRSGPSPCVCPYCAFSAASYQFLSEAQLRYIQHYCDVLTEALESGEDGEVDIDMDVVADAVGKEGEKPAFYVAEQSQQRKFTCVACDEFNDILGRFGYCSLCGTRSDLDDFENQSVPSIRERLNADGIPEDCVRDGVASFDSFIAQLAKQLAERVPMTSHRKHRLLNQSFHNIADVSSTLLAWFDIGIRAGLKDAEWKNAVLMFHRRHVYEHNGGEVDQKYLDESGDTTVLLKQHIHETKKGAHDFLSSLVKMSQNLYLGFHEIFPPVSKSIKSFQERRQRSSGEKNNGR